MSLKAYALDAMFQVLWAVVFHPEFDPEFEQLAAEVQDELLAHAKLIAQLDRPLAVRRWIRSKDHAMPT
jgi:hypothetical protein